MKIFIEEKWIDGTTCTFEIHNPIEKIKVKNYLRAMRTEFVNKLKEEGFTIITKRDEIDNDTICLIMNADSITSDDISFKEYKQLFDQKIANSAGKFFYYPHSLSVEEYFKDPFFPAVFKNEYANGGKDKFLISTPEQLAIMMVFYDRYKDDPKIKEQFDSCIFQQYLETPSKYATYMRVLANGAGEVMGASLKCSKRENFKNELEGFFDQIFLDPDSKFYLGTKKMFNYYSNGLEIYFDQPKYSDEKQEVLIEHGFDMDNLTLPLEVLDVVKNIMHNCNKEVGIMCGMDFMLNKADGKWYYLENQAFPAIEEWAHTKGISLPKAHSMRNSLKYFEIELAARYEALWATVKLKTPDDESIKKGLIYKHK